MPPGALATDPADVVGLSPGDRRRRCPTRLGCECQPDLAGGSTLCLAGLCRPERSGGLFGGQLACLCRPVGTRRDSTSPRCHAPVAIGVQALGHFRGPASSTGSLAFYLVHRSITTPFSGEWHRRRPSRCAVWLLYGVMVFGLSTTLIVLNLNGGVGRREVASIGNGFQAGIGLLLLSVSAATALAEERVRGNLDVLLATPLSTRSIVWGKWWGTFRAVPLLAIAPVPWRPRWPARAAAGTVRRWLLACLSRMAPQ